MAYSTRIVATVTVPENGLVHRATAWWTLRQKRDALVAAKTIFTDNNTYLPATTTAMSAVEPSLTYVAAGVASTGPTVISVNPASATDWSAAALAASGNCYWIRDQSNGPGTTYGSGVTCTGTAADTAAATAFP